MAYNPYGTYMPNPYGPQPYPSYPQPNYPQPQQAQQQNVYAFVNGIEGAKSYPMQPNQTVMLMDSDQPIMYKKASNNLGQATIRYFKLTEVAENEVRGQAPTSTVEYATRADFEALAKRVDELAKPTKKSAKEE